MIDLFSTYCNTFPQEEQNDAPLTFCFLQRKQTETLRMIEGLSDLIHSKFPK